LRQTKIQSEPGRFDAPTVNRQRPGRHDPNGVGNGGRNHRSRQPLNASRLLQDFGTEQDGASPWPLKGKPGGAKPSAVIAGSVPRQPQQRSVGSLETGIEDKGELSNTCDCLGCYDVKILIVGVLCLCRLVARA